MTERPGRTDTSMAHTSVLSSLMKSVLAARTKDSLDAFIRQTDPVDVPADWQLKTTIDGIRIYRKYPTERSDRTTIICATMQVKGKIEDVASYFDQDSTVLMQQKMPDDMVDCDVICRLPTDEVGSSYTRFSVKYAAYKAPTSFSRKRDFCYLEGQKRFEHSSGRNAWALNAHSIGLSNCPPSKGYVRGDMYSSGYVFVESEAPGYLDGIYLLQVDFCGSNQLARMLHTTLLRRKVAALTGMRRFVENRHVYGTPIDTTLSQRGMRSRCTSCKQKFWPLLRHSRCISCERVVCRACAPVSISNEAHYTSLPVPICKTCHKRQLLTNSSHLSRSCSARSKSFGHARDWEASDSCPSSTEPLHIGAQDVLSAAAYKGRSDSNRRTELVFSGQDSGFSWVHQDDSSSSYASASSYAKSHVDSDPASSESKASYPSRSDRYKLPAQSFTNDKRAFALPWYRVNARGMSKDDTKVEEDHGSMSDSGRTEELSYYRRDSNITSRSIRPSDAIRVRFAPERLGRKHVSMDSEDRTTALTHGHASFSSCGTRSTLEYTKDDTLFYEGLRETRSESALNLSSYVFRSTAGTLPDEELMPSDGNNQVDTSPSSLGQELEYKKLPSSYSYPDVLPDTNERKDRALLDELCRERKRRKAVEALYATMSSKFHETEATLETIQEEMHAWKSFAKTQEERLQVSEREKEEMQRELDEADEVRQRMQDDLIQHEMRIQELEREKWVLNLSLNETKRVANELLSNQTESALKKIDGQYRLDKLAKEWEDEEMETRKLQAKSEIRHTLSYESSYDEETWSITENDIEAEIMNFSNEMEEEAEGVWI